LRARFRPFHAADAIEHGVANFGGTPDLTEAQRLMESVQQAAQHLVALDQVRSEELKQKMKKLPSGR